MEQKNIYDEFMDEECIALCDALNELPGVETFGSCCGHLKRPYMIWFNCTNPYSLAVIARAFDDRYCGTSMGWRIHLETKDCDRDPQFCYGIYSEKPFQSNFLMRFSVGKIVDNINYWSGDNFKEYFKYDKYVGQCGE